MRKWYFLTGLAALGVIGLVSWATLGSAQTVPPPNVAPPTANGIVEPILPMPPPTANGSIKIPDVTGDKTAPVTVAPTPAAAPNDRPPVVVEPGGGLQQPGNLIPPLKAQESPVNVIIPGAPAMQIEKPLVPPTQSQKPLTPSKQAERPLGEIISSSHQEPAVSLEWIGPSAVKVGIPAEYTVSVRNICAIPVQKVFVQVRVPAGVNVVASEPKAEGADNVLVWELGTLLAHQDRRLSLKLLSSQRGDLACQAWVTFTGSAVMKMRVREPKLLVKVAVPDKVIVGDPTSVVLTVSNMGDLATDNVKITAMLPDGLECVRGKKLNYDIGTLAAGETRTVTVSCVSKTPGQQKCDVFAEAEGGLKSGDTAAVNVVQPRLDLVVAGPKMRYVDKRATYTLKVSNPGEAPATNVFITDMIPRGFRFVQADSGGQHDEASRSVKWFIGELGAGQAREVKVELLATAQGEFSHKVFAHASHGMKAEQEVKTIVEGLAAILMELVDTEDPVEVGSDTAYEIKVTNTGSKAETDVRLICTVPAQMKIKAVHGPVKYDVVGNDIVFQPLPQLTPKTDAVYKVTVTAVQKGDARFKAALTTTDLVEPVVKVEPTKVYAE